MIFYRLQSIKVNNTMKMIDFKTMKQTNPLVKRIRIVATTLKDQCQTGFIAPALTCLKR